MSKIGAKTISTILLLSAVGFTIFAPLNLKAAESNATNSIIRIASPEELKIKNPGCKNIDTATTTAIPATTTPISGQSTITTPTSFPETLISGTTAAAGATGDVYGTFLAGSLTAITDIIQVTTGGADFYTYICERNKGALPQLVANSGNSGFVNIANTINVALLNERPLSNSDFVQQRVYALTGRVSASGVTPLFENNVTPAQYSPGGTGFSLLQPIQAFWGWSTNIVFGILILIIIGIAFAIIFRQRIGGKEMVQIQNAIPSIALAMILVPLSYSISGLFIDVITIGSNAVHAFFFTPGAPGRDLYERRNVNDIGCANPTTDSTGTSDDPCDRGLYIDDERLTVLNFRDVIDVSDELEGVAGATVTGATGAASGLNGNGINSFVVMDIIRRILDLVSGTTNTPAYWFGEIINFIIGILMIWIGIKIAIRLLKAYITLIIVPIFSPFIFITVAVPGNSTNAIVNYLKMMGGAAALYIVTYLMFILTYLFTSGVLNEQLPSLQRGIFVPPLLGFKSLFEAAPSGTSQSFTDLLFAIVGIGIYFSIPKVLDDISEKLGGKFTIPDFVTAPIDAIKESYQVTTRTAPALAARTALTASRLTSTAASLPLRAFYKGADAFDGLRGMSANDPRTLRNRTSRWFGKLDSRLQSGIQKSSQDRDGAGVAAGNAARGVLKAIATGSTGRVGGVPDEPSIKVTFKQTGSSIDNMYLFSSSEIQGIIKEFGGVLNTVVGTAGYTINFPGGGRAGNYVLAKAGELVFEASNGFNFFPPINGLITMYNADGDDTDLSSPRNEINPPGSPRPQNALRTGNNVFAFGPHAALVYRPEIGGAIPENELRLIAGSVDDTRLKNSTTISIPFNLEIRGPDPGIVRRLFGTNLDTNGLPDLPTAFVSTNPNGSIRTDKVGFAIGPVSTNTIQLRFKVPVR